MKVTPHSEAPTIPKAMMAQCVLRFPRKKELFSSFFPVILDTMIRIRKYPKMTEAIRVELIAVYLD